MIKLWKNFCRRNFWEISEWIPQKLHEEILGDIFSTNPEGISLNLHGVIPGEIAGVVYVWISAGILRGILARYTEINNTRICKVISERIPVEIPEEITQEVSKKMVEKPIEVFRKEFLKKSQNKYLDKFLK